MIRFAALTAILALAGCGYVGAPLAPTLDMPSPVTDFRAWQYGSEIAFQFTLPKLTTEGLPLKEVESIELGLGEGEPSKHYKLRPHTPGEITDSVPVDGWIGKTIVLAIRATGPKGKTSVWSNRDTLMVIPPLLQPSALKPLNVEQGVHLTWAGSGPRYRIFRSEGNSMPLQIGESDRPEFLDENTTYGTLYRYQVQAIADPKQWSEISMPMSITPEDKFPPAIPSDVSAIAAAGSVALSWSRNIEADFRGYNVFRSVDGSPFEKVASLIPAPAFTDMNIELGKKYRYAISAVDLTGNESHQSEPKEVTP